MAQVQDMHNALDEIKRRTSGPLDVKVGVVVQQEELEHAQGGRRRALLPCKLGGAASAQLPGMTLHRQCPACEGPAWVAA